MSYHTAVHGAFVATRFSEPAALPLATVGTAGATPVGVRID